MTDEAIGPVDLDCLDGARIIRLDQWESEPNQADVELFLEPCTGPTLDVGCGPGRLTAALIDRQIMAVGIDVAEDAVRLARERGAQAIRRDVFADVPGEQHWQHILLADGNIGIGGDPAALLTRIQELLAPNGEIIVEVAEHGVGSYLELHRLQIGESISAPFPWAVVGMDAIADVADKSGLRVSTTRSSGCRQAVTLVQSTES